LTKSSNGAPRMLRGARAVETAASSASSESRQDSFCISDRPAYSIIHDLRNPLAVICGCAEMLLDANPGSAQASRIATNLFRAASRMRQLLSSFADLRRGHTEMTQVCNLRAMIEASCEAAGAAGHDGIAILLNVPESIEIELVRTRMERVFVNLIVNALEAMPLGGAIRITAMETAEGVLIEVEDTGPGIPAEIRSRLFEPFVTAGKRDGLGLGLALSRQTVREHGGELWAEPAEGARFIISLPFGVGRLAA